jgi:DNA primase
LPRGQDPDEFVREKGADAVLDQLQHLPALIDFKLEEYRQKGQLATSQQKAKVTRELLVSAGKITDTIQRSFVIQDLARKLHLDEAILWAEVSQLERKSGARSYTGEDKAQTKVDAELFFSTKRGAAELGLLEIAFLKPVLIPKILEYVDLDEFTHKEIRHLFQQLRDSSESRIQEVAASIRDPIIAKTISNFLFTQKMEFKSEKFANDCVVFLKLAQIDEKIVSLRQEMQSTDGKKSHDLLSAYKSLHEQRQMIENVVYIEELR